MADMTLHPTIKAVHGKIGDLVFKQVAGKEIGASKPSRLLKKECFEKLTLKIIWVFV